MKCIVVVVVDGSSADDRKYICGQRAFAYKSPKWPSHKCVYSVAAWPDTLCRLHLHWTIDKKGKKAEETRDNSNEKKVMIRNDGISIRVFPLAVDADAVVFYVYSFITSI